MDVQNRHNIALRFPGLRSITSSPRPSSTELSWRGTHTDRAPAADARCFLRVSLNSPQKRHDERSFLPFWRWRNWVSVRLRDLPQVPSPVDNRAPRKAPAGWLPSPSSFHRPTATFQTGQKAAWPSTSPGSVSGFSALGEWLSLKSILEAVIIL